MDLPTIAVIGSQSAGKSSLIESISGITLPRAAGTCTRCPTECRLSYSEQAWKCRVVLSKIVDGHGQALGVAENIPFGATITDKADVEERIRRAQRAILNPSVNADTFLLGPDGDLADGNELSFSKNSVCLEIKGPDMTDLSFCDLPGLIVSVSQGNNDSDIQLVRDLVESHIRKPSCLILLTVTCETDFENQGAHHMAKQFDPEGQRTIGVLTKPDRIPAGEEDHWMRFIRGEAEHLRNGWFVVKQPATVDLRQGITWEEARERERHFFETTTPWATERDYRHRFGTRNLTESLSDILSELIKRRLPELEVELQNLLKETAALLERLPPAPSEDAQGEVVLLVSNFARELATYVEGTPEDNGIHQLIRPLNREFSAAIRGTAQKFCPFGVNEYPRWVDGRFSKHYIFLDAGVEPTVYQRDDEGVICVDKVIEMAESARARELPGHTFYIVTKKLIRTSTDQWKSPSHELLDKVYANLSREVNHIVDDHFGNFRYGRLHHDVVKIVSEVLANCHASALKMINQLLTMENKAPFTTHDPYLAECKEKLLREYRSARTCIGTREPSVMSDSSEPEELIVEDLCEVGFLYMATARAYFQVAFKRFADMVPMMIDQELLRGLDWDRGLNSALNKGLGITGPGSLRKAKEYLQELPETRIRRENLTKRKERLESARRELFSI